MLSREHLTGRSWFRPDDLLRLHALLTELGLEESNQ